MKVAISWVLIAAGVLIALGGFLMWSFGNARYREGDNACHAATADTVIIKNDDARKTKEKSNAQEKAIPDADVDAELLRLGILRPD